MNGHQNTLDRGQDHHRQNTQADAWALLGKLDPSRPDGEIGPDGDQQPFDAVVGPTCETRPAGDARVETGQPGHELAEG